MFNISLPLNNKLLEPGLRDFVMKQKLLRWLTGNNSGSIQGFMQNKRWENTLLINFLFIIL